ncbi:MAG: hypothetical protein AABZ67_14450 [Pseudomonadota bacterium]
MTPGPVIQMGNYSAASPEAEAHDPNTWMGRVRLQLTHAPRSPAAGRRIWPVVEGG